MRLLIPLLVIVLLISIIFSSSSASGFLNEISQTWESGKGVWSSVKDFFKFEWAMGSKTVEAKDCASADCYQDALSKEYKNSEATCASWILSSAINALAEKRIYLNMEEDVLDYCTVKKSDGSVIGFCCYANECKQDGINLAKNLSKLKGDNLYAICREYDESDCFKCAAKS